MSAVFETTVKKQGRIIIPSNIRIAKGLKPGDWVVIQVDKIGKKRGK